MWNGWNKKEFNTCVIALWKEKSFTPIDVPVGQGVCKLTTRHRNPITSRAQHPHRSLQFFLILHSYRSTRLCTIYPGGEVRGGGSKSKTPSPVCLISVNEIYNAKQKGEGMGEGVRVDKVEDGVQSKFMFVAKSNTWERNRTCAIWRHLNQHGAQAVIFELGRASKIIIHNNVYRFHWANISASDSLSV